MKFVKILNTFNSILPQEIQSVEILGDQLIIEGKEWSLVFATCWWRVVEDEVYLFGCTDESAEKISDIKGLKIIEAIKQSSIANFDVTLVLSNGWVIESFSTSSLEPWSLKLKDIVFFADPSSKEWICN